MKLFIDDITTITEGLRSEYEATHDGSGRFRLKVEGDIPEVKAANDRLSEFRDNNISLKKKQETLEAQLKNFEGIDPVEFKTLKTKLADIEKTGNTSAETIQQQLQNAVAEAVGPLKEQLTQIQQAKENADKLLKQRDIEVKLSDVAGKTQVRKSAMKDFVTRGLSTFDLEGIARNGDKQLFSEKNPAQGLGMEEWATKLMIEAPHLFEESKGGGAGGGDLNASRNTTGQRVVSSDPLEFGRNLEDLASGKATI